MHRPAGYSGRNTRIGMARYKLILAYDGTHFQGFQRQGTDPNGSIGVGERALRKLGWEGNSILSSGRTDSGVHASGQVVAFDLDWKHPLTDMAKRAERRWPNDVAVQAGCGSGRCISPALRRGGTQLPLPHLHSPRSAIHCESDIAWRIGARVEPGAARTAAAALAGQP